MQLETIWLCRDLDVVNDEWSLIRVTRRFPARTQAVCISALLSDVGPGSSIAIEVDLFRVTAAGSEPILIEPQRFELQVKSTRPETLVAWIVAPEPLKGGDYFASLTLMNESYVASFEVEGSDGA